jgi:hypothetical protein
LRLMTKRVVVVFIFGSWSILLFRFHLHTQTAMDLFIVGKLAC